MCVIYACATKLPDESELQDGAFANDDGAGLGWVVNDTVFWRKGLSDANAILKTINDEKIPFPLVIHFRTASAGGRSALLTHPFPVDADASLSPSGQMTANPILFHNGHMSSWEDLMVKSVLGSGAVVPRGPWSDSRVMAWLAYSHGTGLLPFVIGSSRVCLLYPKSSDPADPWGNFEFFGNWHSMDGWKQSTLVASRFTRTAAWPGTTAGVVVTHPSTKVVTADDDAEESPENVWTVEELSAILTNMEKELEDARSAAGAK